MTTFSKAIETTEIKTKTNNGAATLASSLSANLDLFFMIGASREKDINREFEKAFQENSDVAMRILLWARDVRGGAGERKTFRELMGYIEKNHKEILSDIIPMIPVLGRWDDLLIFKSVEIKEKAYGLIAHALIHEKNSLCAKWMPRQAKKDDLTAYELRKFMNLDPVNYRKLVVGLTNVVEQKMCSKDWDNIDFSKIPSLASSRYSKAFEKNAKEQYAQYKEKLVKGETKINAGAIFPHDVLKAHQAGADKAIVVSQWNALPNYLGDNKIIPMIDVSGSMDQSVGGSTSLTCMDVSIAIGLYIADKQIGPFKDIALTFSEDCAIEILKGDIVDKINQVKNMHWGMSTNIEGGFKAILDLAVKNNIAENEMPKYLLVLSDMEFNEGISGETAFENVKKQYKAAGYKLPKIIFWTLNARSENVPVRFDEQGTALVSGFSTNLLASLLKAQDFTPENIMLETVMVPKYDIIKSIAKEVLMKKMKM